MESTQRLLVVDDHPLFRKGVIQLIQMISGFTVIGEASSGQESIKLAAQLKPDMILLDLDMRDMSGLEVLKTIKSSNSDARIVMLTVSDQAEDLVACLRAGADGYLLKEMEPEDLLTKLQEAASGHVTLTERLINLLAYSMRRESPPKNSDEANLTKQEYKILNLIAEGKSNKLIARQLDITESTVKVHVKHILRKLSLRSRVEAAVWFVGQLKDN